MPKYTQYSIRDSFENLNRQDRRKELFEAQNQSNSTDKGIDIPISDNNRDDYRKRYKDGTQKTPPSPQDNFETTKSIEYDEQSLTDHPTTITIHKHCMDQFKLLPPFLKKSLSKLAKQYAITQCKQLNTQEKLNKLKSDKDANILPTHMKHQQKLIDKFTDINVIHKLIHDFIDVEYESLLQTNESLNLKMNERYIELSNTLEPITTYTSLLDNNELELKTIFDCLIEQEFCNMLMKQRDDKLRKATKKEKFEAMKAKNTAIATITVKELNNMKKQIKQAQKLKQPTKPKNGKGKTGTKKPTLPKTNKRNKQGKQQGKQSNDSKNAGNTKGTKGIRQ